MQPKTSPGFTRIGRGDKPTVRAATGVNSSAIYSATYDMRCSRDSYIFFCAGIKSYPTVGGGVGFLAGMYFVLLVVVVDFFVERVTVAGDHS